MGRREEYFHAWSDRAVHPGRVQHRYCQRTLCVSAAKPLICHAGLVWLYGKRDLDVRAGLTTLLIKLKLANLVVDMAVAGVRRLSTTEGSHVSLRNNRVKCSYEARRSAQSSGAKGP